jgi:predicted lipoprotein
MTRTRGFQPVLLGLLALAAILAAGCGGGGQDGAATPGGEVSREQVIVSLADGVFVPAYREAADAAERLATAVEQLQAEPSPQTLGAARSAWREARLAWSRTLAFDFGPAEDRRSMVIVDWLPVDPAKIEQALARPDSFTVEYVVEFLGSPQRGLGAIEYVLFSPESDEQALEQLRSGDGRRIEFLLANAQAVAAELNEVYREWMSETEYGHAYRDVLTGEAPVSIFVNGALTEVVSGPVFLLQTVADMQLVELVDMTGGGMDLSRLPSVPSGTVWQDIRSRVAGVRDVYVGAESGLGLSDLIVQLSGSADARMKEALNDVLAAFDAMTLPVERAAVERPEEVRAVFLRLKDVQRILNTEVVSLLGVSTGFSDNDGDSSN